MRSTKAPLPHPTPVRCHALLPCAGTGSRAGGEMPKQYRPVAGKPVVLHALTAFQAVERIGNCLVVVSPTDGFSWEEAPDHGVVRCGGASRAETVFNGLQALLDRGAAASDWVLVHDAARCLVEPEQINALLDACWHDAVGGLLALPLPDTLKVGADGRVAATLDRADKWLAQTPQMFRIGALHAALGARASHGFSGVTDEASAMEMAGHRPRLVPGSARNFKLTYPEDFALAEAVLSSRMRTDPA